MTSTSIRWAVLWACLVSVQAFAVGPACPATAPADDADSKEIYANLLAQADQSALFAAAKAKHALTACEASGDADAMQVTWTFDTVKVVFSASPGAGVSARELVLEQPEKAALALLATEEKRFASPGGCGINWKKPAEQTTASDDPEAKVKVFRAAQGNCQGRVTTKAGKVVKVKLSGAS